MTTPVYVSLNYEQYKAFEEQFAQGCKPLETTHSRDDARYYHKAIRFEIGDLAFEVTGPGVMAPTGPPTFSEGFEEAVERSQEEPHR